MIFFAHRCTREYPSACLFDSLYKIENWVPVYQICYCLGLLSSRQRKMWNSCCNRETPRLHHSIPMAP